MIIANYCSRNPGSLLKDLGGLGIDKNTFSRSLDTKQVQTRCQFSFILMLFDFNAEKEERMGRR